MDTPLNTWICIKAERMMILNRRQTLPQANYHSFSLLWQLSNYNHVINFSNLITLTWWRDLEIKLFWLILTFMDLTTLSFFFPIYLEKEFFSDWKRRMGSFPKCPCDFSSYFFLIFFTFPERRSILRLKKVNRQFPGVTSLRTGKKPPQSDQPISRDPPSRFMLMVMNTVVKMQKVMM